MSQIGFRRTRVLEPKKKKEEKTHFFTVSESPMTVNDRLGRVIATATVSH